MKALCVFALAATFLITGVMFAGTTGKIVGTVKDARTGEPLPSANITLEGTSIGGATNIEGFFTILNVPPGRYRVNVSLVGYRTAAATDVKVDIDQTTTQNFTLTEEAVTGEEITVVALRPVVQRDVAASRANIEIQDVTKLPVVTVQSAVSLQAGIQPGLVFRGGTSDQTAFIVDGVLRRDPRTLNPNASVSLSSIMEIQAQTGGFAAEYGDLRSGVVNVVTREGDRKKYTFNLQGRYSPAQPKHFGPAIYDANGYWIRPYVDPAVAWTGTSSWDQWTQRQYPKFEGWNAVSAAKLSDADPTNDLTPEAAQQVFLWEHRRQAEISQADWDGDIGFGGPVPFAEGLGNLRFFYSYITGQQQYLVPLSVDGYKNVNNQLKVTSDLSGTMKLMVMAQWGKEYGTTDNNAGNAGLFQSAASVASTMTRVSYIDAHFFATDYWAPSAINNNSQAIKLTHNLGTSTFYEALVQRSEWRYDTNPGQYRDTSRIYKFGNGYYVDEAPFGYQPAPSTGITGLRMGVGFSNSRDTTRSVSWSGKIDVTSQIDRYNQLKGGLYLSYTNLDLNYGNIDIFLPSGRTFTHAAAFPWYGAAYIQDKLEFELMVATVGVRLDYVDPNTSWYDYDSDPYTKAFAAGVSLGIDTLLQKSPVAAHLMVSPRIGVAFPITEYAKFFFNYGHQRQIPAPQNLFRVVRTTDNNQVFYISDPRAEFPRTIAYELGYEHSLFDEYLLRVAGYYKDYTYDPLTVQYTDRFSTVDYGRYTSNRYRDVRGFEVTFSRNRGNWVQGFANYTYSVLTRGYFGYNNYYQNPTDMANEKATNVPQERPIPAPYARLNVDFFTPRDFGGQGIGQILLGDWRVNLLGTWNSGTYITWVGGGGASIPGITNNFQWVDYWNMDMRVSKTFTFGSLNLQLFADVSNLFNTKYLDPAGYGFYDGADYDYYMKSLHLPDFSPEFKQQVGYVNVPGDDKPGDYRDFGVAYQPIEAVKSMSDLQLASNQNSRPFYYVAESGKYYQWTNSTWQEVDHSRLQKVLDDKAYIDMPNQETFWFLNPQRIYWGVRLSFNL
jgi:Carboxypeptidase regulatory-like domain